MNGNKRPSPVKFRVIRPQDVIPLSEEEDDGRKTDVGPIPDFVVPKPSTSPHQLFATATYDAGETVVDFFHPLTAILVILEGRLVKETYATSGATEVPVGELGPGDLIGAEAFSNPMDSVESQARYVAMTDVIVYAVHREALSVRDPHLREARQQYLIEALSRQSKRAQEQESEFLSDRLRLHDLQATLETVEGQRESAIAKVAELKTYCDRFVHSDAAQSVVRLRAELDRLLDERRREALSLESVLGTQLELNRQIDEELQEMRQGRDKLLQSFICLDDQFYALQASSDPKAQMLGVYCLGVLHGLKMRTG